MALYTDEAGYGWTASSNTVSGCTSAGGLEIRDNPIGGVRCHLCGSRKNAHIESTYYKKKRTDVCTTDYYDCGTVVRNWGKRPVTVGKHCIKVK